MREIGRDEPYEAANWLCQELMPAVVRKATNLPWPIFEDLPILANGGRLGVVAAGELHRPIQAVMSALDSALGDDNELTTMARWTSVIVNECKFQRQSQSIRQTALERTVEIARLAVASGLVESEAARAVASWEWDDDDAPPFGVVVGLLRSD